MHFSMKSSSVCPFFGFGIGLVRIMEGGHFVSDVVMAAMILYLSHYFQMKYYFNKYD